MSSPHEMMKMRQEWYRDGFRQRGWMIIGLIGALLLSILFNIGQWMQPCRPTYFASTCDGRVVEMKALDQPHLSDQDIINWAVSNGTGAYTFRFDRWEEDFGRTSRGFTPESWAEFAGAMDKVVQKARRGKLNVRAVLNGATTITERGTMPVPDNGRVRTVFYWKLEYPILVTYESSSEVRTDTLMVSMTVVRRDTLDEVSGLGIHQYVTFTSGSQANR